MVVAHEYTDGVLKSRQVLNEVWRSDRNLEIDTRHFVVSLVPNFVGYCKTVLTRRQREREPGGRGGGGGGGERQRKVGERKEEIEIICTYKPFCWFFAYCYQLGQDRRKSAVAKATGKLAASWSKVF